MIGKTISHYKILEKLDGGGMGVVYKAQDLKLDRFVVLKFLPPLFNTNDEAKIRFINEARAASALEHPNICSIYEISETEDDQLFIVMPFYEGETLKKKIAFGKISASQSKEIILQIAKGLQKAHQKGIIHRDIKPANIFVTEDGIIKILDFGLAKISGDIERTREGTTLGTAAYMSPEQTKGEKIDIQTDIWSLGVVFYEMISGTKPFRGDYESAVIYSILNEEPLPFPKSIELENPGMENIIFKCLKKSGPDRYNDLGELIYHLSGLKDAGGKDKIGRYQSFIKYNFATINKKLKIGLTIIILLVCFFAFYLFITLKKSEEKIDLLEGTKFTWKNSIAVLPFDDLSPAKDQEYFCDGMAEEIILKLTRINDLKVIARTSMMRYKNQRPDIKEIGKELGVATVLEGSVRKDGNQVNIIARLIKVEDGSYIWDGSFNSKLEEIFEVQRNVSKAIAQALKVRFNPQTFAALKSEQPTSMEAYEYYLKTMFYTKNYIVSRDEDEFNSALYMANKALALDSTYSLTYAVLAWVYANRYAVTKNPKDQLLNDEYCQKAYQMNPNLAQAQSCMAWHLRILKKYDESFKYYKSALEINPNNFAINQAVGLSYDYIGLIHQAIEYYKKAVELDPFYLYSIWNLADCYILTSDYDKALYYYDKCIELSTQTPLFLFPSYVDLLIRMNNYDKAKQMIEKMDYSNITLDRLPFTKALYFASLGSKEMVRKINVEPTVEIFAMLHEEGKAIELLKRFILEGKEYHYLNLLNNPYYDNLRKNPFFLKLVEEKKIIYEYRLNRYGNLNNLDYQEL